MAARGNQAHHEASTNEAEHERGAPSGMLKGGANLLTGVPLLEEVGLFIIPGFSLLTFSAVLDVLRQCNRVTGEKLYRWHVLSEDGKAVDCSGGVTIDCDASLGESPKLDFLMVFAGINAERYHNKSVFTRLRAIAKAGCSLGSASSGTYILARAGLLENHRCTVHWEDMECFKEAFPMLQVSNEVYEIDGDRITSSGGISVIDAILARVREQHGRALAAQVADILMQERIRDGQDLQRMPLPVRLGVNHPRLVQAIELIECNLERPYSQGELASRVGLSSRQIERLFRRYLDVTPSQYALQHRLKRARQLLRNTSMGVLEVAVVLGFTTASHFTKSYKQHFQLTPSEDRQQVLAGKD
jgi:transcriptional regulator GlxA family with amidase domain